MSGVTCSLLTPPGVGAIAVIGLWGDDAWVVATSVLDPTRGSWPAFPSAGEVHLAAVRAEDELIDDVVVIVPDDGSIEICCHGGPRVVQRVLAALLDAGAVLQPAEACDSDDWKVQLQSITDGCLARTTTAAAAAFLARQRELLPARLESILSTAARGGADEARALLAELLEESVGAWHWAEPAEIALIGPPNAGKSLLANRLAGRTESIVSPHEGTTRDWVTIPASLDGLPVQLLDTAGIRATDDPLEHQAIARGVKRVRDAALVLVVINGSRAGAAAQIHEWHNVAAGVPVVVVQNKLDLGGIGEAGRAAFSGRVLSVSAATGEGVGELVRAAREVLRVPPAEAAKGLVFARFLQEVLEKFRSAAEEFTGSALGAALAVARRRHADSGHEQGYNR